MNIRNDRSFQQAAVNSFADNIRNKIEWLIRAVDGDKTFYNPDDFEWTREVENAYPAIYNELQNVLRLRITPSWQSLSNDPNVRMGDKWKTFIFCGYGNYVTKNCELCPETYKAIKKIKGITTAWFSILEPHTKLPVHEGPYNGVLRYHLGLMIPSADEKKCGIQVGEESRTWQNGKSLIFDDSHKHAAWNLTADIRVVLFVDFVRPLPFPVSWLNRAAIYAGGKTKFAKDVIKKAGA